jgi:drug/metabolite transporter (DMT)-like permease
MEVTLKALSNYFNPVQLVFLRFFIGSLVLMPLALKELKQRECRLNRRDFAYFALTGFINIVVSMMLFQMAIVYAPASVVAVLICCNPIFVVLFASLLLREKIYNDTIVSMIVSMAGVLVIMNPLKMTGSVTGFVLTLLAAVTFALYCVVGRPGTERHGCIASTCGSFIVGSMEMLFLILLSKLGGVSSFLVHAGLTSFANVPLWQGITPHRLPALLFLGVGITGLGYVACFRAMEATSTTTGSLIFFIKPALAPVLALLILHEAISVRMVSGIVLILVGSLVTFIPSHKRQMQENTTLDFDLPEDRELEKAEALV